jgi:hypothetical protein
MFVSFLEVTCTNATSALLRYENGFSAKYQYFSYSTMFVDTDTDIRGSNFLPIRMRQPGQAVKRSKFRASQIVANTERLTNTKNSLICIT